MLDQTYITFAVNDRLYGLPARDVHEVIRMVSLVAPPYPPGGLAGLLNLRGQLIAVLDLRWAFSDPPTPHHPDQHLLIIGGTEKPIGILVDRALELISPGSGEITRPHPDGEAPGVIGVVQRAELSITLLENTFLSHHVEGVLRQNDGEWASL